MLPSITVTVVYETLLALPASKMPSVEQQLQLHGCDPPMLLLF